MLWKLGRKTFGARWWQRRLRPASAILGAFCASYGDGCGSDGPCVRRRQANEPGCRRALRQVRVARRCFLYGNRVMNVPLTTRRTAAADQALPLFLNAVIGVVPGHFPDPLEQQRIADRRHHRNGCQPYVGSGIPAEPEQPRFSVDPRHLGQDFGQLLPHRRIWRGQASRQFQLGWPEARCV